MRNLTTLADINEYIRGVEDRILDHGERWRPVVQTLAFVFQSELAPGRPLQVRTFMNNLGNQVRFTLRNGREFKVTYHGSTKTISVRDANTNRTLRTFSWRDKAEEVAEHCHRLAQPEVLQRAA